MPHFIVEYSENLKDEIEFNALFTQVHECLGKSGVFPLAGIRSRAYAATDYRIADAKHDYAFVHFLLKIGSGREESVRVKVADELFSLIENFFAPLQEKRLLAISFEMQELHPVLNYKKNNIHAFLNNKG
ncbi:5-carboxymethyl-2-hydroxymuconate Delta-isomerase [Thorsellia kenyensis]|uniref:5-carboxymethyl-2-hydroxymuconate Delta-isomerase n=1 Tax=Thorsellia kenyensis TaxID=1549888 RepID=A0ABV6CCM4_9GAMM